MDKKISEILDRVSKFLSDRKGLLPTIGLMLIIINFFIVIFFPASYVASINFFLHLGLIITVFGFLIAPIL